MKKEKRKRPDITKEGKELALSKTIALCHAHLFCEDTVGLDYLYARGITDESIKKFKIGLFPLKARTVASYIGVIPSYQCGITKFSDDGIVSKFTTHRLIIPIYDVYGTPEGIIGRCLMPEAERKSKKIIKYDNTYYKKGGSLFGLNIAKDSIRDKNKAILVEGNFDVIMAHQKGMNNVIASSGSFFSRSQLMLLSRYATKVGVLFDNDDAGILASTRTIRKYSNSSAIEVKKISLSSEYKDLDEYLRRK